MSSKQDENQTEEYFITTDDLLKALKDPNKPNFSDKDLSKVDFTIPETRHLSGANLSGASLSGLKLLAV